MKNCLSTLFVALIIVGVLALPGYAQSSTPTPTAPAGLELDLENVAPEDIERGLGDAATGAATFTEDTLRQIRALLERTITSPQYPLIQALFVIGGFVLLALGWVIYDEIVAFAGVMVGAALLSSFVTTDNLLIQLAAVLVGALIGGVIGFFLFYVGVFVIGAYVGVALTFGLVNMLALEALSATTLLTMVGIGAIVGGLLMLALSLQLVIAISALVGAQMLTLGLNLGSEWLILLTIGGIAFQWLSRRIWRRRQGRT